jgi:glycosyltransferase involved in cell wall biosynthesis
MKTAEKVSIIVPTYNRKSLLAFSVDSILQQTFPVTEVIIVDDGSTDGTAEEVELRLKNDPVWRDRVRFIYQENQGQSAANNAGIAIARGDWLGFNASDDIWLPNKLELQFEALRKFGDEYGVCFSDAWFMNNPYMKHTVFEASRTKQNQIFGVVRDAIRLIGSGRHPIWMQTALIRADIVRAVGGVDRELRYSEDHDFMFRLSLQTKFCFVTLPLVLIDRSPAQTRHSGVARDWHKEEFCLRMEQMRFEKQLRLSANLSPATQELARQHLGHVHQSWVNLYLEQGNYLEARKSLATASKYGNSRKLMMKWVAIRFAPSTLRSAIIRDKEKTVRYDRASWLADTSVGTI